MISWIGLLEASVSGGICIALFFFISQLCGEKCPAKYKKVVWLLIALRLCIPISFSLLPQALTVKVPVYVFDERENSSTTGAANYSFVYDSEDTVSSKVADGVTLTAEEMEHDRNMAVAETTDRRITSQGILIVLWSCGCFGVLLYYLLGHVIFCRKMLQKSESCTNKNIIAATIKLSNELGLKKIPEVRLTSDKQTGPYTVGFFRNIIVLPDTDYHEKDLKYILKHELVHCADKDTQLKVLFVAINAVHWFNPLVWFMKALIDQDMELECDEKVLSVASKEERSEYSEVLMSCIGTSEISRSTLSTGYVHGVKFIKKRFNNIFHSRKRIGKTAVCIMVIFLVAASGLIGFEAGRIVYAGRRIEIDSGIELRTDVTGDGVPDRVYVIDNNDILITNVGLETADGRFAYFYYDDEMWAGSYLVCGDLSGNGTADIVVMRISFGMHGTGEPSVLHVTEGEEPGSLFWQRYPENFIHNPAIDMDQPDKFEDIGCVGATVIEENGRYLLRLIALDMVLFDDDTVQCIDCSWQSDGWYIEDMRTITGYLTENRRDELLRNNNFHSTEEGESADTEATENSETSSAGAEPVDAERNESDSKEIIVSDVASGVAASIDTDMTETNESVSEDNQEIKNIMNIFAAAYFEGDTATIQQYLVDAYEWNVDVYSDPDSADEVQINKLKGIADDLAANIGDECVASLEFRNPGEDSYTYLTVEFVKEESGWKIRYYGVEK